MKSISQEHAAAEQPLSGSEAARFWRAPRFRGMECLSATFITHEYAPHAHDTFSIGAIESGSQIATIQGAREETGPGDLYLINPGDIHDGAPGRSGYRYRMIYPDAGLFSEILEDVSGLAPKGTPAFAHRLVRDPELAAAFHHAHRMAEGEGGMLEADEGMFRLLSAIFLRHGAMKVTPLQSRERSAAARVRDYIEACHERDIGLSELAAVSGLSRAHMIRSFRREFFITPHAYLTDLRIRKARRLLRLGQSPAEVALACGFADQAHLTRHFKARNGVTPGQFRGR